MARLSHPRSRDQSEGERDAVPVEPSHHSDGSKAVPLASAAITSSLVRRAQALFRRVKALYPASFVAEFGDDMDADFREACAEHQSHLFTWLRWELAQDAVAAILEWTKLWRYALTTKVLLTFISSACAATLTIWSFASPTFAHLALAALSVLTATLTVALDSVRRAEQSGRRRIRKSKVGR